MISIDVKATLKKAEEDKLKPKALPKITVANFAIEHTEGKKVKEPITVTFNVDSKDAIVKLLWTEFHTVSIQQKKLSTQIAKLVDDGVTQERLKKQYADIESYQPKLLAIREKIRYVEKFGKLPTAPEQEQIDDDINALKVKAKSLVEKRSKLKTKLKAKIAKNPERFVLWEQELAAAEIEWQHIENRIKTLQGK